MARSLLGGFGLGLVASLTLPLLATFAVGCSGGADAVSAGEGSAVTDIPQSGVKDQSTENCWVYASIGWTESLVKRASGTEMDLSESYLSYWHWFDQLVAGSDETAIAEGGDWNHAAYLIAQYGYMNEADFIPNDEAAGLSARQATAVKAMNDALTTGALKDASARHNRTLVRQTLDKAWGLTPAVTKQLDSTFGASVSHTLDSYYAKRNLPKGVTILKPSSLPAMLPDPKTHAETKRTMADAIGSAESKFDGDDRVGTYAWQTVSYPDGVQERRDFMKRVQRALHDGEPVFISWEVDFNALDDAGTFKTVPATVGDQGGHLTLITDYQVTNVPAVPSVGFAGGTLAAGVTETRPEVLAAALSDQAQIEFVRIKNSWGTDYHALPTMAGFDDLYMAYLDGPMKTCGQNADGTADLTSCSMQVPFHDITLPPGY